MNDLRADANYYITQFRGSLNLGIEDADEIELLLNKAYDNISYETMGRSDYLEAYSEEDIEKVKRAACYEAEAIYSVDGPHLDMFGSFRIGDYWVDFSKNKGFNNGGVFSKRARALLENTALKDRWL